MFAKGKLILLFVLITAVASLTVSALSATDSPSMPVDPPQRTMLPPLPDDVGYQRTSLMQPQLPSAPWLSWSKVAFQSYRDGNWEIYTGNDDGGGQKRLTVNDASDIHAMLNRGGTQVVFASNRDGDYELFTMNPNGTGLLQLTINETDDVNPVWSPDGSQIAFQAYRDGQPEIYVMQANGTGPVRLTTDGAYDGYPTWSPDGSKLAFTSNRTGDYSIYTMNADGSNTTQITTQPSSVYPAWSPDGSRIAYSADADNDTWLELWIVNADGSDARNYHSVCCQTDIWAKGWSPDGQFLAYTTISFTQYQGNWYWISAYLDAFKPYGYQSIRLSNSGVDWHPGWQTLDNAPPQLNTSLAPYTPVHQFEVRWQGTDNLSGIDHFETQVQIGNNAWVDWPDSQYSYQLIRDGQAGETYRFRMRGVDRAFNTLPWEEVNASVTTLYTFPAWGLVTDNRGTPLANAAPVISPDPVTVQASSGNGRYQMRLAGVGSHRMQFANPSYGPLPAATTLVTASIAQNWVLPPPDDLVPDGGFEMGDLLLSPWEDSGTIAPTLHSDVGHSGNWALGLGQIPGRLAGLASSNCVRLPQDAGLPACDYTSIQDAIDNASPGETIWVFPGIYQETFVIDRSDLHLRSVLGAAVTIIDASGLGKAIVIHNPDHQLTNILFEGFTIEGASSSHNGNAIYVRDANEITIRENRFEDNYGGDGAIDLDYASAEMVNNWFIDNYSLYSGSASAISANRSTAVIANNIFWHNDPRSFHYGVALELNRTGGNIHNNTFVGNHSAIDLAGFSGIAQNNILVNSKSAGILEVFVLQSQFQYNNVWNNHPNYEGTDLTGTAHNISAKPHFVNITGGDFRLLPGSPSRDAGNPTHFYNDSDGSRNDMGAFGGPLAFATDPLDPKPAWQHHWIDVSAWAGQAVTISFQIHDHTIGNTRTGIQQNLVLPAGLANPTLSFLFRSGAEPTPGHDSFNLILTPAAGAPITHAITSSATSRLWVLLDEVSLGSAYADTWIRASSTHAPPGNDVALTVHYGNHGGVTANNARITMTLPADISFVAASIPPISITPLVWGVGDLPATSEIRTMIVTGTISTAAAPLVSAESTVEVSAGKELERWNNVAVANTIFGWVSHLPILHKP